MALKIWALTRTGRKLARSTTNPDAPSYRVIAFLDGRSQADSEQIAEFTGLSTNEVFTILYKLKLRGIVVGG